jgi:hypothetical protein
MSLLEKIQDFSKSKMPSILKDPFGKSKITKITVTFEEPFWSSDKNWKSTGWVHFKNGNTKGEQTFTAEGDDAFDQVVLQMRAFIQQLEK